MKIGELFLQLGIKGSEKTLGALSNVTSGLKGVGSTSLEAKAAILATIYAFERLMSSSAKTGTEITNFTKLTGITGKTLQQYQYAAAQVGISNEEIASSFKSVQNVMTSMRFGKGAPEGMAMLMGTLQKGGGNFDPNRAKTDIEYVMRKLQEYANLEKDITKRNLVMKSFGLGENVVAGMARNAFRPEVFKQAPIFTDKETNQLDKVNAAFANLGIKIKMAVGQFTALHGGQLVKDFTLMADAVIKLANSFEKLSTKAKLFETIAHGFEGIANTMKLITEVIDKLQGKESKKGDLLYKKPNEELFPGFSQSPLGSLLKEVGNFINPKSSEPVASYTGKIPLPATTPSISSVLAPKEKVAPALSSASPGQTSTQNNNVNQTFNFTNSDMDHKQVGNETQKAITKAFYQIPQGGY